MTMHLINTTGRLLHAAYSFKASADAKPVGKYLQLDESTPGIAPGAHDIDEATARLVEGHPTNQIFFATGMLEIKDGPAPKVENPSLSPKIFRADPRALAVVGATKAQAKSRL